MNKHILVVDDQPNIRKLVSYNLEQLGYKTDTADNGRDCLEMLLNKHYAAVLLDIQMPVMDGMETLEKIKEKYTKLPVIMVTAMNDVSLAVKAVKLGAQDYLTKPIDFDRLETELKNAIEIHSLRHQVTDLKQQLHSSELFTNIIGQSKAITNVFQLADRVLNSDASVLIIGESGSGKELLARAIHNGSERRTKVFVPVNCAAITRELADSLLFGHKKGSFTGANEDRQGYFEQADEGTIFLDEIGDMELEIQAKVLRVLEEKTIRRVGEKNERQVNFRVIAATNRDLIDFIRERKFRKDLYYRLEEYPIFLPPLRKRKEDIILLAQHFLQEFCEDNNMEPIRFSEEVQEIMKTYHWPGNIRELKNVVRRAALRVDGNIITEITFSNIESDTHEKIKQPVTAGSRENSDQIVPFEQVEMQTIERAFVAADRNAVEAARLLGISRATVYRKLKQFGIE